MGRTTARAVAATESATRVAIKARQIGHHDVISRLLLLTISSVYSCTCCVTESVVFALYDSEGTLVRKKFNSIILLVS